MERKRIIITLIFLSMFVAGTILIFTVPIGVKASYYHVARTYDGELISFNVFEPEGRETETKPAVIIGHGVIVNKEILKGYAIELALAGYVAVPFDFRGHGMSTGLLDIEKLPYDIAAIKTYLRSRGDIDMNKLAYIGYSMGGFPINEILKDNTDFRAFIGIGTGLTTHEDKVVYANSSRYLNILMILAQYDEAFSLSELKEGVGIRLNMDPEDVVVNRLYGNFDDGNATEIFYDDNSDHLLTAWDQDFIREARDWVMNTFPEIDPLDQHFYANIRALIFLMQIIGGIGLYFLIIEPISKLIIKNREEHEDLLKDDTVKEMGKKTIIYSFLGIPGVAFMIPLLFAPLILGGAMAAVLFGQVFGVMLLLRKYFKKAGTSLWEQLKKPFKEPKKDLLRQIILGTILGVILYLILYVSIGLNYLGMAPSVNKVLWIPLYLAVFIFIFLVFHLVFNILFDAKFGRTLKELIKSSLLAFGILTLYLTILILAFCIAVGNYFLLMVLVIAIPIYLLTVFTSALLFQKTGSIIPAAIANTIFLVLLLATLSPFGTPFTMLSMLGTVSEQIEVF